MQSMIFLAVFAALAGRSVEVRAEQAPSPAQIASAVLGRLDSAWNAGDGAAFAREFSDDGELVNIFGTHFRGRPAISERMQVIFTTMFKGSRHESRSLESASRLGDDIILAVSSAVIAVPSGPQAPQARNRQSFVLVRAGGGWQIRHWHNTSIQTSR